MFERFKFIFTPLIIVLLANTAYARDNISMVGSSTVYPLAITAAEYFGLNSNYKTPKIESTGSGGGFKLFCKGVGTQYPDITAASRKIADSEKELCKNNGVKFTEIMLGYDGIVMANKIDSYEFNLTTKHIFLALAKFIPDEIKHDWKINNYLYWNDIDPKLPKVKINVIGPPPTSGTRDSFVELVMESACKQWTWIDHKDDRCKMIREDGTFIEAGENDNLIIQKLRANKDLIGIFGFVYLINNMDLIKPATINNHTPDYDTISSGEYVLARPLFIYAKNNHVTYIPDIIPFLRTFTAENSIGDEGYLVDKGLIPLTKDDRNNVRTLIDNIK